MVVQFQLVQIIFLFVPLLCPHPVHQKYRSRHRRGQERLMNPVLTAPASSVCIPSPAAQPATGHPGKAIPNPIQYRIFLEKREALKTIIALEDLVEQYALTNVKLPMVVEQINNLREKYDLYEQEEKKSQQSS